jgi:hypothetical protein
MWCGRTNAVEIWLIIWVMLEVSGMRRVMPSMIGGKYDVVSSTDGVRKWDKAKVWIKLRVVRQHRMVVCGSAVECQIGQ